MAITIHLRLSFLAENTVVPQAVPDRHAPVTTAFCQMKTSGCFHRPYSSKCTYASYYRDTVWNNTAPPEISAIYCVFGYVTLKDNDVKYALIPCSLERCCRYSLLFPCNSDNDKVENLYLDIEDLLYNTRANCHDASSG